MEIKLGGYYTDNVHEVTGVATARISYLERTPQTLIEWVGSDGCINERWFEDSQLEDTGKGL